MRDTARIVVGPATVSGPGPVDPELAALALDCLDDDLALVDDRPVSVDALWRDVLAAAVGRARTRIVLIHPSWWAASRVDRVRAAADQGLGDVVTVPRSSRLTAAPATVEVATELVVVTVDGQRHAIARGYPSADTMAAVAAHLDGVPRVTLDVPDGLGGFGAALAGSLRERGVEVTVGMPPRRRRLAPRAAAVLVAVVSASGLAAAAVGLGHDGGPTDPTAWLVEGLIAVEVPASWTVERITAGPGTARVQVSSPRDRLAAVHVAQVRVPDGQTLDAVAETLRTALAAEPDGVFTAFVAPAERARRAAVTYREVRADRHVEWTVLLDGGVRIAIGCQGASGHPVPEPTCAQAIASAHAIRPSAGGTEPATDASNPPSTEHPTKGKR